MEKKELPWRSSGQGSALSLLRALVQFLVHVMLNPSMQNFKHELASMGDGCNCLMVSTFFFTTLENWDED